LQMCRRAVHARWRAVAIAVFECLLLAEARTSYLQSRLLSLWTAHMTFEVRPGPNNTIRFPQWGPYDERLGYTRLPPFIASLTARHFAVARQAQWSPSLDRFVDQGGYAIYNEKSRAGLQLLDRDRSVLYDASYPLLAYRDFASIPPLVVDSLLFIEDHRLLDQENPRRNPAVDWSRFMLAELPVPLTR
jgi:membrane peptidoglycan carboxypeptidase